MGHGEGLNPEINEEPVQLSYSMSDRIEEYWPKIRSHHWGKKEVIGQLTLNIFGKSLVRHAGCCGDWGLDTPGYPISHYFHRTSPMVLGHHSVLASELIGLHIRRSSSQSLASFGFHAL